MPIGFFQDGEEVFAFALAHFLIGEVFGIGLSLRGGFRWRGEFGVGGGEIEVEGAAAGEDDGAFDDVAEFADVAGPIVGLQANDAGLGEARFGGAHILRG